MDSPYILKFFELLPILILVYGVLRYIMRAMLSQGRRSQLPVPQEGSAQVPGEQQFQGGRRQEELPVEEGRADSGQDFHGEVSERFLGDIFGDTRMYRDLEVEDTVATEPVVSRSESSSGGRSQGSSGFSGAESGLAARRDKVTSESSLDDNFARSSSVEEESSSYSHEDLLEAFTDTSRVQQALIAGEILQPRY